MGLGNTNENQRRFLGVAHAQIDDRISINIKDKDLTNA